MDIELKHLLKYKDYLLDMISELSNQLDLRNCELKVVDELIIKYKENEKL